MDENAKGQTYIPGTEPPAMNEDDAKAVLSVLDTLDTLIIKVAASLRRLSDLNQDGAATFCEGKLVSIKAVLRDERAAAIDAAYGPKQEWPQAPE